MPWSRLSVPLTATCNLGLVLYCGLTVATVHCSPSAYAVLRRCSSDLAVVCPACHDQCGSQWHSGAWLSSSVLDLGANVPLLGLFLAVYGNLARAGLRREELGETVADRL